MSTTLWYDRFTDDWMWALPLGNGRIGGMFYGNPHCEQIEINEESLWCGRQIRETYHASPEQLKAIRDLLFQERLEEADALSRQTYLSSPHSVRPYESFGEIFVDFPDHSDYTDYCKKLELRDAMATLQWTRHHVSFHSECFLSADYDALVYRVMGDAPFDCSVTMKRKQDAHTRCVDPHTVRMEGQITYAAHPEYGEAGTGVSFGSLLYIDTDGIRTPEADRISIQQATYVTVYGAFATNYSLERFDVDESIDYLARLQNHIDRIIAVPYDEVRRTHIATHRKWFDAVAFHLDAPDFSHFPTDERLRRVRAGENDPDLLTLYYHFGRYLLMECSGKNATLPANLQGIWCHDFNPPWGSDYHTNINIQMNYWPAESANLSAATAPFIHLVKRLSQFGTATARELFQARGWVVNHTTDIYGRTGVHDRVDCGFFPMAGPWLCLNLWEHYEYTNDRSYLNDIYPILKGACAFVCDYLTEDPHGQLVTAPSNSPENRFYYTHPSGDTRVSMLTYGASIDFQIIDALFTRMIYACNLLNRDEDFADMLRKTLRRLPPVRISKRYGTIQEWIHDYEEKEPGHRHISHLFALYPGDRFNESDPVLFEAAKRTIRRRIENGGGATGWSRAWIVCFYARLKDGHNALLHLNHLLQHCTADNLFDMHPPFQIDGNFGGVAGINEMLVQSHMGQPDDRVLELLPALPPDWVNGFVRGLKARGNFTVDLEWKKGRPATACITATQARTLRLKLAQPAHIVEAEGDYILCDSMLTIAMKPGATLRLQWN